VTGSHDSLPGPVGSKWHLSSMLNCCKLQLLLARQAVRCGQNISRQDAKEEEGSHAKPKPMAIELHDRVGR
jgi:hypothetical protein